VDVIIHPLFATDTLSLTLKKMVTDESSVTNKKKSQDHEALDLLPENFVTSLIGKETACLCSFGQTV
jgi:hypothetical protein